MMSEFICWVAVVALIAAFALSLADKWGIIEYLQVHAPNYFRVLFVARGGHVL